MCMYICARVTAIHYNNFYFLVLGPPRNLYTMSVVPYGYGFYKFKHYLKRKSTAVHTLFYIHVCWYIHDWRVIYIVGIMYTLNIITFVTPLCTIPIYLYAHTFYRNDVFRQVFFTTWPELELGRRTFASRPSYCRNIPCPNRLLQIRHHNNSFDAAI